MFIVEIEFAHTDFIAGICDRFQGVVYLQLVSAVRVGSHHVVGGWTDGDTFRSNYLGKEPSQLVVEMVGEAELR